MSLKAFHIIFIICSTLFAFSFSAWAFWTYSTSHSLSNLMMGIVSILSGAGLLWYGKYFLKKLKNISYL